MDPLSLAILAINGLRTVLVNPALGGGSSATLGQASELLGILGTLLQEGDEALEDLKIFTETIEEMVAQGRGPNRAEWDVLRTRSADAHARLQAQKAALLGEEPEEETVTEEPVTEVDLSSLTKAQLLEVAEDRGVEVSSSATKAQIIEAIEAHDEE